MAITDNFDSFSNKDELYEFKGLQTNVESLSEKL